MSQVSTTYFCDDPAASIAEMIEDEQRKGQLATRMRDKHRADTSVRAYKEALRMILLTQECADGKKHPMPDVDAYLAGRTPAA